MKSCHSVNIRNCIVALLLLVAVPAFGTNVRGQVITYIPYYNQFAPAPQVRLVVNGIDRYTGGWVPVAETLTQPDGMYYMTLAPGNYYFYFPATNQSFPISISPMQRQDIAPIRLGY